MSDDDEMRLLERWCAGDRVAGGELFKRHFAAIYRFFDHKVDKDVDDLVQETFLACVRERQRFQRQSSFRTYLFSIARYTLYGYWRTTSRRVAGIDFDDVSVASLSTSAPGRLARQDDHSKLLAALQTLPLEQQLLLELHYWEELERDQLAEIFEVEPATTRSRLFRARQALRERLADASHAGAPAPARADEELDAWARGLRPASPASPASKEVRNAASERDTTG
jgi:RNA polymerase sigma factor (sigma-70 family)